MLSLHLGDDLQNGASVVVDTKYGPIKGGRAVNGAAIFLEVPYALPPGRFEDPKPLPSDYRYGDKPYIKESKYPAQPNNDGQTAATPYADVVGLGVPSEDCLFVNIVCPPSFTADAKLPVKFHIHGGFLQFGSAHVLDSQGPYVAAARNEIRINVSYRLSVFGFLACDEPKIDGNFGFKDQWLALMWVQENIASFGGDPNNVQISGLSAGAHSVHQILHHASRLPDGQNAPFKSAQLQSNAMLTVPKTPAEFRPQFHALCRTLGLDPTAPDILTTLRDRSKVLASTLVHIIETDAVGVGNGTFRGCLDGSWLATTPDPLTWQRTGDLARSLRAKGVKAISTGDLTEEWYLYAIAHPINGPQDVFPNILRYYPKSIVEQLVKKYRTLSDNASAEESKQLIGEILADGQIHIPVRMFVRDFQKAGFPVFRYEIQWTPEEVRPMGYVTHATDRPLWTLRVTESSQVETAVAWLDAVDREMMKLETEGKSTRKVNEVLALKTDRTIGWMEDKKYDSLMEIAKILPGES